MTNVFASFRTEFENSESELRLLADSMPVLISYLEQADGEVRYRFANKLYETWFPYRRHELIGRPLRDIVGDAAFKVVQPRLARAFAGERVSYEAHMPYAANPRHVRVEYVPRFFGGEVVGVFTLIEDITQAKQNEAALRESEEDYRHAAELNPQVAWTALPDGQLDRVAPRWMDWTGTTGLGASYADALHPEDVQRTFDVWGRSVSTGETYDIVHRVRRLDGGYRWIRSRAYPRRDEQGRIVRWYGTTEDIHEQKTAEDHQRLMVLELNHRVKNNLATVQAIATQTLRGAEDPIQEREAFLNRIQALAVAHDILTRERWEAVGLGEVAHGVLDALTDPAVLTLDGPPVRLDSRAALSLAMAFHELATNALKYGALSQPEGRVAIGWSYDDDDLSLEWRESGGPPVEPPTRRGFGTRLLERGVASELGGRVELDFQPPGLVCRVSANIPRDRPNSRQSFP